MAKFQITTDGVDGTSKMTFSHLSHVANYIKARDLGEEYRRSWGLQGEYVQYFFQGFTWNDIRPDGEYLPFDPKTIKVSFRQMDLFGGKGCLKIMAMGQPVGLIFFPGEFSDKYRLGFEYLVVGNRARLTEFDSLDEAKTAARKTLREWAADNETKTAEESSKLAFRDDS